MSGVVGTALHNSTQGPWWPHGVLRLVGPTWQPLFAKPLCVCFSPMFKRYMASITWQYLCADHTFKTDKYVRGPEGDRMFEAIFTVMNESMQIVGQYMVQTKSWMEIEPAMKQLWQRYNTMAGIKGVAVEDLVSYGWCRTR